MDISFEQFVAAVRDAKPTLAFVLGSGMSGVPENFAEQVHIPFSDVSGLTGSTVVGHSAQIALGECGSRPILLFRGRLHFYEGHPWERVGRPITYAAEWGIRSVILTNAAGGIRSDLNPGSLMAITDNFGWLNPEAWKQPPLGSVPSPYSSRIVELLKQSDVDLQTGVYGGVTGPTYETPAEIQAIKAAGADAVGMSTVYEAKTAQKLGLEVGGISLITNKAAGITGEPLNHKEVLEVAKLQTRRLSKLIEALCRAI